MYPKIHFYSEISAPSVQKSNLDHEIKFLTIFSVIFYSEDVRKPCLMRKGKLSQFSHCVPETFHVAHFVQWTCAEWMEWMICEWQILRIICTKQDIHIIYYTQTSGG